MRLFALLFLVMEIAQWTIIALLVIDNRQLRQQNKSAHQFATPPRSVVED